MSQSPLTVTFPYINPNEPEMVIASLLVENGQWVSRGDILCTIETTKATQELEAEQDGYIFEISAQKGQIVRAGEVFCVISPDPAWQPSIHKPIETEPKPALRNIRITQPALKLAQEARIDLQALPPDELITVERLKALFPQLFREETHVPIDNVDPNAVLIYGGGGHGKSLIELIRAAHLFPIAGIIDDAKPIGSSILNIPVVGQKNNLAYLYQKGFRLAINAVGGIGDITTRIRVFETLHAIGFRCPTVIHPTAFVEKSVTLAEGAQIFPHAYIGSDVRVGYGVIVNTGAIVSHDCVLEDYVNLSPGAILAGEVTVGAKTLIGMGVTVNLQVHIGEHCRIGNGANIKRDVPSNTIVHAGEVW